MVNNMSISPISDLSEECSITFELLTELAAQNNLAVLKCGHKFSKIAIKEWLQEHPRCPNCLKETSIHDVEDVTRATDAVAQATLNSSSSCSSNSSSSSSSNSSSSSSGEKTAHTICEFNNNLSTDEAIKEALKRSLP